MCLMIQMVVPAQCGWGAPTRENIGVLDVLECYGNVVGGRANSPLPAR